MNQSLHTLDAIVGEQLSSVEFVQDYVQLHFDGPYIIAFTWPLVETEGNVTRYGHARYRDILCERIARKVQAGSVIEGEAIRIQFDDGSTISISLKAEDRTGPESALYKAGDKASDPMLVF